MTGELESGVLSHLYEHLGDLKSFIEDFYHYFQLLEYLNQDNLKTLFVIYLECEGVLTRCLKYFKDVKYGQCRAVFKTWCVLKSVASDEKWTKKLQEMGIILT